MFKSVSKLRLLGSYTGLPGCGMKVEINGGGKRDDSNINGGMRDKNMFLDGADFLILTRGMRDRFKIDGGSRLRSLLGQLNCSSNQRSEV